MVFTLAWPRILSFSDCRRARLPIGELLRGNIILLVLRLRTESGLARRGCECNGDISTVERPQRTSDFISERGDPSQNALDRRVLRRVPACRTSEASRLQRKQSCKGQGPRFPSPCSHRSRRSLRPPEHSWFQRRTSTPAR